MALNVGVRMMILILIQNSNLLFSLDGLIRVYLDGNVRKLYHPIWIVVSTTISWYFKLV